MFSVGVLGGNKGSWFDLAGKRSAAAFAEASRPGGFFEQAAKRSAAAFAEASKPGGFFEQAAKRNAAAFAEASKPGGFFEQAEKRSAAAFAEASKPGGFFEQAEKRSAAAFKAASSRPKVKGVKKDGKPDRRCNAKTLKRAAGRFDVNVTDEQVQNTLQPRYRGTQLAENAAAAGA